MQIRIISAEVVDDGTELGKSYVIRLQHPDGGVEVNVLPLAAVASDMELYGVEDPIVVVDWRLHGYRAHLGVMGARLTPAEQAAVDVLPAAAALEHTQAVIQADPVTVVSTYAGRGHAGCGTVWRDYVQAVTDARNGAHVPVADEPAPARPRPPKSPDGGELVDEPAPVDVDEPADVDEPGAPVVPPAAVAAAAALLDLADVIRAQVAPQVDALAAQVSGARSAAADLRAAEIATVKASRAVVLPDAGYDLLVSLLDQDAEDLDGERRKARRALVPVAPQAITGPRPLVGGPEDWEIRGNEFGPH